MLGLRSCGDYAPTSMLAQFISNCLVTGAIYSLVASGFSLTYHVHRMFNFAHGAIVAVSAYALYYSYTTLRLPLAVSAALGIALAALCGLTLDRFIYKHFRATKHTGMAVLVASFALLLLSESIFNLIFGPSVKSVYPAIRWHAVRLAGASITSLQIAIVGMSVASLMVLFHCDGTYPDWTPNEGRCRQPGTGSNRWSPLDRIYTTALTVSSVTAGSPAAFSPWNRMCSRRWDRAFC